MELTHELVQPLVEKIEAVLPCEVTIMNERGIIVGSRHAERIGFQHRHFYESEPFVDFEDGVSVESQNTHQHYTGIGEDIVYRGKRIGVFGLVGDPVQVSVYMAVGKAMLELLLDHEELQKKHRDDIMIRTTFIRNLLFGKLNEASLRERAAMISVNLDFPRTAILIRMSGGSGNYGPLIDSVFNSTNDLILPTGPNRIAVLTASGMFSSPARREKKRMYDLNSVKDLLVASGCKSFYMACGEERASFMDYGDSYSEAEQTLHIAARLGYESGAVYAADCVIERALLSLPEQSCAMLDRELDRILGNQKNFDTYMQTIRAYAKNDGRMAQAAEQLHIHRNTLQYRLEQLTQDCGTNESRLQRMMTLYLASVSRKIHVGSTQTMEL